MLGLKQRSTPICTGRCLSCTFDRFYGLPLPSKYDLCTQMTSYNVPQWLESLGT